MNQQNTQKLFMDFPRLFRGRTEPLTTNLMSLGFCCGEGWFLLIYGLSKKITEHSHKIGIDPKVKQVKEKFGGLRFYIDVDDNAIFDLIEKAEEKSFTICEKCGKPGKTQRNKFNWLVTICPKCRKKFTPKLFN